MRVPSRTISTQTVADLLQAMSLETIPVCDRSASEVVLHVPAEADRNPELSAPFSDISSVESVLDGRAHEATDSSEGMPVQDERD